MNITLGDKIKVARVKKGLKQSELAEMIGIKNTTISNWEKNVSKPDADYIGLLCGLLDINPSYLFDYQIPALNILSEYEEIHIKQYRKLDAHGKKIVDLVTAEELKNLEESKEILDLPNNIKDINAHKEAKEREKQKKKRFKLYDLPVSAGTGVYLDSSDYDMITVPLDDISDHADFAVRVSGDSMEDQYYDDDVLLVRIQPEVEYGELGIFIIDGEGYFKQFGKDRLISLNKDYKDIVFNPGMEVSCKGRVLGKL